MTCSRTKKPSDPILPDFFWICEKSPDVFKENLYYTSHKNFKQLKIYPLFLLNEKYLALMYDKTPLNTLQLSFLLISQQRYYMGTIIPILQIKKKNTGSQRDSNVMYK